MRSQVEELYSRGKYRLEWDVNKTTGALRSPYLQIVWYDPDAGRLRSRSTGTENVEQAETELDALYSKRERGKAICPTCGQIRQEGAHHLVTDAIADYLVSKQGKPALATARPRLAHVTAYLESGDKLETLCSDVDADWIDAFRDWALEVPVHAGKDANGKDKWRARSPGTVEGSVTSLAAAINAAFARKDSLFPAGFAAKKPSEVSRTPSYRSDVKGLAAMFRYCVAPEQATEHNTVFRMRKDRAQLHRFLQVSVATWARPDAAHDVSTARDRDQWHSNARALNLNPRGRAQTKKHRPIVPIGQRMAARFDETTAFYVSVGSVSTAFQGMQDALKLPRDRETGMKLIRRSMSHIARARLGERDWIEGQIMLGHRKTSTSDTYAPFEVGYLARALAVTDQIIEEIEALCPGAFGAPADVETANG